MSTRTARVIAIANQKGGVGKSTTAVSLGAALAELRHRVLVVDLDPQGNASTGLGIRHEARDVTVYDVLAAEAPIDGAIVSTPVDGLFAIPSTIDLAGAEIELVSQFSRELRLRRALEPLHHGAYDFVFLDCPPSLGLLTVNALAAAQELIVPIQCEYYALEGLGQLLRNVRLVQQNVNPALQLTGIVMTMYDPRTKLSEQVVAEVRRYFGERVYETIIPRTVRLSEAPGFGQPITVYDPRSRGAESYRDLAAEVVVKLPVDEPLPSFEDLATGVGALEPEPRTAPHPLTEPEDDGPTSERTSTEASAIEVADAAAPGAPARDEAEAALEPTLAADVGASEHIEPAQGQTFTSDEADAGLTVMQELSSETDEGDEVEEASMTREPPVEPEPPSQMPARRTGRAEPDLHVASPPESEAIEREWIHGLEAEVEAEGETHAPAVEPAAIREIALEPEDADGPPVDAESVVVIEDRDAAGRHSGDEPVESTPKRRWGLFRRGGDR